MKYLQIIPLALILWMMVSPVMAEEPIVHQVQTANVIEQNVDEVLHIYGKVSFDDAWSQNINLAYAGQIVRLPVLAGEPVVKGQLLAEIVIDPAAAASYQQAVVARRFSESELSRVRSLLAEQLTTKSQLAAAEKAVADSQAQLRQLKQQGLGKVFAKSGRLSMPWSLWCLCKPVSAWRPVSH